jgi:tetratricopeptide (TPR) repeat protein
MPDCCANPKPVWTARRAGEHRYADTLLCGSCGTVHNQEPFVVPVIFPAPGRCLNCGATLEPDTETDTQSRGYRCEQCGLYDRDALVQHHEMAEEVGRGSMLDVALQCLEVGRQVRALKLATAQIREDPESAEAHAVRLQILETLGYGESAAREAWRWAQEENAPDVAWTITADLERSVGNIGGAIRAMQRLVRRVPGDKDLWMDYAELLLQDDQRATAIDSAAHGLDEEPWRSRALSVITDAAQRAVNEGKLEHARKAFEVAGDFANTYAPLVWVRAQAAARDGQVDEAVRWLERTLQIEPGHAQAKEAMGRMKPPVSRRWRFWGK